MNEFGFLFSLVFVENQNRNVINGHDQLVEVPSSLRPPYLERNLKKKSFYFTFIHFAGSAWSLFLLTTFYWVLPGFVFSVLCWRVETMTTAIPIVGIHGNRLERFPGLSFVVVFIVYFLNIFFLKFLARTREFKWPEGLRWPRGTTITEFSTGFNGVSLV